MKKGEVWLVELPFSVGHEQSGLRPVIVMADLEADICVIVPITSNVQALRFPHTVEIKQSDMNGLEVDSVALVFQLRAIDKSRIKKRVGTLEKQILGKIDEMVKRILNL